MKPRLLIVVLVIAAAAAAVFFLPIPQLWQLNNRIPTEALHALESDPNLILYSLDPQRFILSNSGEHQPLPESVPKFHTYRILGQTVLASPESRRITLDTIRHAVRDWDGEIHGCFDPRHGIRATNSSGTYDFVICFKCRQIYLYSPYGPAKELYLRGSPDPLNQILTAAHVPLPLNFNQ